MGNAKQARGAPNSRKWYLRLECPRFCLHPCIRRFNNSTINSESFPGLPESALLAALKRFPTVMDPLLSNDISVPGSNFEQSCTDMKKVWKSCQCHLELCIGWYPCGLKYCKGKGENKNSAMTYRCGIKTCRKCHLFSYYVPQKQLCLWDE